MLDQAPSHLYCGSVSYVRALLSPHKLSEDTVVHSISVEQLSENIASKVCLVRLPFVPSVQRVSICSRLMLEGTLQQLSVFKRVVDARAKPSQGEWIPYRDSTLTTYLQEYLSGNSRLIFVSDTPSPIFENARNIRQCIQHNQVQSLKRLKLEISALESQSVALESKAEYSSGSKDIYLLQSHLKQQISRLKSFIIVKKFKQDPTTQAETRGILTESEINKAQMTEVKQSHVKKQLSELEGFSQYRFSTVSQNLRLESQILRPRIDTPVSNQDNSSMQEITIYRPQDSPFKTVDRDVENVPVFETGRVSLLSPNLIRLNSLCSISSVRQADIPTYKDELFEQFSDIKNKLKSASALKATKKTMVGAHSSSTLELMDKLSQAFATPLDEKLLDGDVMSELNRMSLPYDLLRTRKLEDIKFYNSCGEDLFKDEILLNEDIDKQFLKLPTFLTRQVSQAAKECVSCDKLLAMSLAKDLQIDDLQRRLKETETHNTALNQEKTELVEYVGMLEQQLAKEQELNRQSYGLSKKRQLSLIFEEDNESNSD